MEIKISDKIDIIDGILNIWCRDEHQFINYLRPTNPLWIPDPMKWVFRGQGHSKWRLIPNVFRNETIVSFNDDKHIGPASDIKKQLETEWDLIYNFLWMSDEIGLEVPGDGNIFRDPDIMKNIVHKSIDNLSWPPKDILQTMALAQHHGVPTRLLDFTRNGLYAAFFAAKQCNEIDIEKEIGELGIEYDNHGLCVWAIPRDIKLVAGERINECTVPRNGNRYLHAQNGLFLYDGKVNKIWKEMQEYPVMEKVLQESKSDLGALGFEYCAIKIILPFHKTTDLLRCLRMERITIAHLMPSFDRVVEALKMQIDKNLLLLNFDNR